MKKIFIWLSAFVVLSVLLVICRMTVIDYGIAGTNKFAPDITQGSVLLICKFCKIYPANSYVFVWNEASATYQVLKVVNVLDNKTVFVTDGERSFNLPVSDVQGKVLR